MKLRDSYAYRIILIVTNEEPLETLIRRIFPQKKCDPQKLFETLTVSFLRNELNKKKKLNMK